MLEWIHAHRLCNVNCFDHFYVNKIVISGFTIIFNKQGNNVGLYYDNCKIIYLPLILSFDFNCNLISISRLQNHEQNSEFKSRVQKTHHMGKRHVIRHSFNPKSE